MNDLIRHTFGLVFAMFVSLVGVASAPTALAADMTLTGFDPFRLVVDGSGKAQRIQVSGTGFENQGHPDRDQYMHWQIRRDDGGWNRCAASPGCRTTGWSTDRETFEIGGDFVKRAGFIELRVFRGLGTPDIMDPSQAANLLSGWSNVLRIPVVNPATPPVIKSLSKKEFPIAGSGKPGDYGFSIDAAGVEGQVMVVFRGDTVVWPERVDAGHLIQVTVPRKYQLALPGELSLTVRTDRGGDSASAYIRFVEPPKITPVARPLALPGAAGNQQPVGVAAPFPATGVQMSVQRPIGIAPSPVVGSVNPGPPGMAPPLLQPPGIVPPAAPTTAMPGPGAAAPMPRPVGIAPPPAPSGTSMPAQKIVAPLGRRSCAPGEICPQ